jgi:hypothetical protein
VSDPAFVLIASPFTGPFAWSLVADEPRAHGWPVLVIDAHHLALLTEPSEIADALVRAAALLPA